MIKKIFQLSTLFSFTFPFVFILKYPIKNWGSINLLDSLLFLNLILGFVLIFKEKTWSNFKYYLLKKNLKPLSLFLIFSFLSLFLNWNKNWINNFSLWKSLFLLPILWTIFVSFFIKKKYFNLKWFFYGYFFSSLFLSILTIFFKLLNLTTFDNRVSLFFDSPNQLAIVISLGIISTLYLNNKKNKFFLWSLIFYLPALWVTQSLGALIATGIVLLIFVNQLNLKKIMFLSKSLLIFSLFFLCFLLITPFFMKYYSYNPFENKNSFDSRIVIYLVTSNIITDNFWNGIGLANFQKEYISRQPQYPPYPQWAVPHSHNLFSEILISFGFFNFFLWFYFLFKKTTSLHKSSTKLIFYFLIYFLIHGLIDVPVWSNNQSLFFWFIFLF